MNLFSTGTDRDFHRGMFQFALRAIALAATVACQQGDRRQASGEVTTSLATRPAPIPTSDADVRAAQVDLAEDRPWAATRKLASVIKVADRRTPEAELVAARAAAAWGGWTEVDQWLTGRPWLDSRFDGEGYELLARSALERGDAAGARASAESALRAAKEPGARAMRLALLARALDRLDVRDSAADAYRRAGDALPTVRDWLLLRSAGATADAGARRRLYGELRLDAAKSRMLITEAQTLERFGSALAAADSFEKAADMPSAFRLRLVAARDSAERDRQRNALVAFIGKSRGDDLQRSIDVLDAAFPELDPATQLAVARRAAAVGSATRAIAGFTKVPAPQITESDAIAWARALISTGKPTEAAARLGRRQFTANATVADYVRALALVRAGSAGTRAALQRVISLHGNTPQSADARYLLADFESDAGRDAAARDLFLAACRQTPAGGYASEACFRAGVVTFAMGDARKAAAVFDELTQRFPSSSEAVAATYWGGRAWQRSGDVAQAKQRFQSVIAREPLSYYASASARRLGVPPRAFASDAALPRSVEAQRGMARVATLEQLGMDVEARYELDALEQGASTQPATALAIGAELLAHEEVPRAIHVGWKVISASRGDTATPGGDVRAYRLIYPVLHRDELLAAAAANHIDPSLVAAVIRQESGWNPRALSRAGARGLMQVMPSVGKQIAASRRYPLWNPALLFDAGVSLELGTSHLRAALSQETTTARALAAYNAGSSRVRRWARRAGAEDPELFIERIPFVETRDYVRIVLRNAEIYRSMYALK